MRAVLWDLLLLCLLARVLGDCQRDCLRCDRRAHGTQWDAFNVLICVLECEGQAVPRATWELCAAALPQQADEAADADPAAMARPAEAEARDVQKRYGGFIGVRKSARKWNNQKRFSEFLKQYLGMAPRSSEYDIAADLNEHNEI
ncbi:prepronociceptin [Nothoprocta perdicaria]|uniref:prepronociceptin n=1 Tax=Nothoprocta perdicaria TaxID=30464 RepID=UPI000E1BC083|nr:prepronociceptin [Nothoprocta perdicaria]